MLNEMPGRIIPIGKERTAKYLRRQQSPRTLIGEARGFIAVSNCEKDHKDRVEEAK
jgi:hypothetical protein